MDLLLQCARNYENLLDVAYNFTIARKGVVREFTLTFQKMDFHHIAGLHKLRDIFDAQRGSREDLFTNVLNGKISQELIEKSEFYSDTISQDGDRLFFRSAEIHAPQERKSPSLKRGDVTAL